MHDGINEAKVEAWLNANVDELQGPYTYTLIAVCARADTFGRFEYFCCVDSN